MEKEKEARKAAKRQLLAARLVGESQGEKLVILLGPLMAKQLDPCRSMKETVAVAAIYFALENVADTAIIWFMSTLRVDMLGVSVTCSGKATVMVTIIVGMFL